MSLNNWSYEEVNSYLDALNEQKETLVAIQERLVSEANASDQRIKEEMVSSFGLEQLLQDLKKAEEYINEYINWLKGKNEEAKSIEDNNYNSLDNIQDHDVGTKSVDNNTITSGSGVSSHNGSTSSTGTNSSTGGGSVSSGGTTTTVTTEAPTHSGSGVNTGIAAGVAAGVVTSIITEPPTEKPTTPPTEAPTEAPTEKPTEAETEPIKEEDEAINGATGFCSQVLKAEANAYSQTLCKIEWGEPFRIISSEGNGSWWKVEFNGQKGYVESQRCLINLPDFIPSINYNITNAFSSIFVSSGVPLSVYGQQLYTAGKVFNERLGRQEFIVPLAYGFAKKIKVAQETALASGYCLKIYDAYRPTSVAGRVRDDLRDLYNSNQEVASNIDKDPVNGSYWGKAWFIADGISYHSVGCAIDVTMVDSAGQEISTPSAMHELSTKAVKYKYGVKGQTSVQTNLYVDNLSEGAKLLDKIMLGAGLTNLASEWWHFQDNASAAYMPALDFQPTTIVSTKSSVEKVEKKAR